MNKLETDAAIQDDTWALRASSSVFLYRGTFRKSLESSSHISLLANTVVGKQVQAVDILGNSSLFTQGFAFLGGKLYIMVSIIVNGSSEIVLRRTVLGDVDLKQ